MTTVALQALADLGILLFALLSGIHHTTPERLVNEPWPVGTRIVIVHHVADSVMMLTPPALAGSLEPEPSIALNGDIRCVGASMCVIRLADRAIDSTLPHELAHAVDVLSDGLMDGHISGFMPFLRPQWRPDWCSVSSWLSDVEWTATASAHYGRLW